MKLRKNKGFTLVEILIVVVILGILAAIVIPQFSNASSEARESNLVSNLQALRSQVELFKIQHGDLLPGQVRNADGSVTATDAAKFISAMTSKTSKTGEVGTTAGVHIYGPYMQNVPENPFTTAVSTDLIDVDGTLGDNSHHWHFNTTSALLSCDDSLRVGTDQTDTSKPFHKDL